MAYGTFYGRAASSSGNTNNNQDFVDDATTRSIVSTKAAQCHAVSYKVKNPNETLESVSMKTQTSVKTLRKLNRSILEATTSHHRRSGSNRKCYLPVGLSLLIDSPDAIEPAFTLPPLPSLIDEGWGHMHIVTSSDTLESIATAYNTTKEFIRKDNREFFPVGERGKLQVGSLLRIRIYHQMADDSSTTIVDNQKSNSDDENSSTTTTIVARKKDSWESLAHELGLTVKSLVDLNFNVGERVDELHPGQKVYVGSNKRGKGMRNVAEVVLTKEIHEVQKGETPDLICEMYSMTLDSLREYNRCFFPKGYRGHIKPGFVYKFQDNIISSLEMWLFTEDNTKSWKLLTGEEKDEVYPIKGSNIVVFPTFNSSSVGQVSIFEVELNSVATSNNHLLCILPLPVPSSTVSIVDSIGNFSVETVKSCRSCFASTKRKKIVDSDSESDEEDKPKDSPPSAIINDIQVNLLDSLEHLQSKYSFADGNVRLEHCLDSKGCFVAVEFCPTVTQESSYIGFSVAYDSVCTNQYLSVPTMRTPTSSILPEFTWNHTIMSVGTTRASDGEDGNRRSIVVSPNEAGGKTYEEQLLEMRRRHASGSFMQIVEASEDPSLVFKSLATEWSVKVKEPIVFRMKRIVGPHPNTNLSLYFE